MEDVDYLSIAKEINEILLSSDLKSFEILPGEPRPYLYEAGCLGVSKKLVSIFFFKVPDVPRLVKIYLNPDFAEVFDDVDLSIDHFHHVIRFHKKSSEAWRQLGAKVLGILQDGDGASSFCWDVVFKELDFIEEQALSYAHNYYALLHYHKINSFIGKEKRTDAYVERVFQFFDFLVQKTPLHYGVWHYLIQFLKSLGKSKVDFRRWSDAMFVDFRESETFIQAINVADVELG
jgi:hypothetical protein